MAQIHKIEYKFSEEVTNEIKQKMENILKLEESYKFYFVLYNVASVSKNHTDFSLCIVDYKDSTINDLSLLLITETNYYCKILEQDIPIIIDYDFLFRFYPEPENAYPKRKGKGILRRILINEGPSVDFKSNGDVVKNK